MPDYSEVADGLRMPLADAMQTQRAVRRLRGDPVDDETLLAVLELALRAPTGSNLQNWEFVVVRDPDVKHALARLNRQAWSVYRRMARSRVRGDLKAARMLAAVQWQADHFENAPVIVVACLHGRPWLTNMGRSAYYGSIFPAVQNLLLAARGLGLGAALDHPPALVHEHGPADARPAPLGHAVRGRAPRVAPEGGLRTHDAASRG